MEEGKSVLDSCLCYVTDRLCASLSLGCMPTPPDTVALTWGQDISEGDWHPLFEVFFFFYPAVLWCDKGMCTNNDGEMCRPTIPRADHTVPCSRGRG